MTDIAILVLEDGSVFQGVSIGAQGLTTGEVVFNTAMTGYQEILTDPSYSHQIVTLTYPHIGNVGVNVEDEESSAVHARGLVIRDLPLLHSNWRSEESLSDYLQRHSIVAIADIDTRKLTRILREKGAQRGCIIAGPEVDEVLALQEAKDAASLKGLDLAQLVTAEKAYDWTDSIWQLKPDSVAKPAAKYKVVAYDFGVKSNILNLLVNAGCSVHVVPAKTPASEVLAMKPDGVFLSNGPGDPEPCDYAISAIQQILKEKVPVFGICLGHQLLALASGAKTVKMKFGHHGANHPVQDLSTKRVMITSQNHGFAVDADSLPENLKATHVSLFDKSLQGIERTDCPAFSFQGHPEASPGPQDIVYLFDQFTAMMASHKNL
ncbi:MAG: glutamine-hydrolyzing carbamoyl-phosphate synthase small subunit [Cycloclasticus sp.]|nr:carbamoyl phosphate synthase small subunit [Cycloclasticus sp. 46_83_sub15_T18]OUR82865.1 carbamoyl phosphate synthase small subunit [Cycloclasticus sp. 46_120_T64]